MLYIRVISLFLSLMLSGTALAAMTSDELNEVREQFSRGENSEASNDSIHERLQQLLQQEPDNPLLLAYYGSSETRLGKYAWMPWNKLGHVNDGIAYIERALRLAKDTETNYVHEVQLIAASTYVALPDMFNTFDRGKKLLNELLKVRKQNRWSDHFLYALYRAAAQAAEHDGDKAAKAKWQARAYVLANDKTAEETQQ